MGGDGENFCLTKPKTLEVPFAAWQEVDWFANCLERWSNPIWRSDDSQCGIEPGTCRLVAALACWWDWRLLNALYACYRYENLIQWHWIVTESPIFPDRRDGDGYHRQGSQRWITIAGFNLQPSNLPIGGDYHLSSTLTISDSLVDDSSCFESLGNYTVPWALFCSRFGTSLVFGAITLGMLYWGNANPGWLVLLISPIVAAILFNVFYQHGSSGWLP